MLLNQYVGDTGESLLNLRAMEQKGEKQNWGETLSSLGISQPTLCCQLCNATPNQELGTGGQTESDHFQQLPYTYKSIRLASSLLFPSLPFPVPSRAVPF